MLASRVVRIGIQSWYWITTFVEFPRLQNSLAGSVFAFVSCCDVNRDSGAIREGMYLDLGPLRKPSHKLGLVPVQSAKSTRTGWT